MSIHAALLVGVSALPVDWWLLYVQGYCHIILSRNWIYLEQIVRRMVLYNVLSDWMVLYNVLSDYLPRVHVYMYMCMYVCMYMYICMYVHTCTCMYVHVCMYMYVCMLLQEPHLLTATCIYWKRARASRTCVLSYIYLLILPSTKESAWVCVYVHTYMYSISIYMCVQVQVHIHCVYVWIYVYSYCVYNMHEYMIYI